MPRRVSTLIVSDIDRETVIYNSTDNRAHCLNPTAAIVFRGCDGATPMAVVARKLEKELAAPDAEAILGLALERLREKGLVEPDAQARSRREFLLRCGVTAALIPAIASVGIPSPAMARSGEECVAEVDCMAGLVDTCGKVCCETAGRICGRADIAGDSKCRCYLPAQMPYCACDPNI